MLSRYRLDEALLTCARAAGACVEEGVLVQAPVVDDGRVRGVVVSCGGRQSELGARVVIAADGATSRVARALGLARHARRPRRWAVGAYFETFGAGDGVAGCFGEMHLRSGRYIGIAPLPGNVTNACVVTADRVALRDPIALAARHPPHRCAACRSLRPRSDDHEARRPGAARRGELGQRCARAPFGRRCRRVHRSDDRRRPALRPARSRARRPGRAGRARPAAGWMLTSSSRECGATNSRPSGASIARCERWLARRSPCASPHTVPTVTPVARTDDQLRGGCGSGM